MKIKYTLAFMTVAVIILLGTIAVASSSTVVATDSKNDVTKYTASSSNSLPSVVDGQTKDVVDIVSISYGLDANNNATITLTLKGTPVLDGKTFYFVSLDGGNTNISVIAYSGSYTNTAESTDSYITVYEGALTSFTATNAKIDGNSIVYTLPRQLPDYVVNYTTFDVSTVWRNANFTSTANSAWQWYAEAWTGTIPFNETSSSTSGTWWMDDLNATSSSVGGGASSKGLPGMDIVPVLGFLTLSAFVTLVQKRRPKN